MRPGSIFIGIIICITAIFIYLVKNQEILLNFMQKLKKKKSKKIMIISVILILIVSACFIKWGINVKNRYKRNKEVVEKFEIEDKKMEDEESYYLEMMSKQYENQNYNTPYIPEGFSYVEGEYNTGYVIGDENGNEYVWVPCTNEDIEGIVKLERKNFVSRAFITKETCYNKEYREFIKSALENGGFYISRYEIGKENNMPVSKKDVEVWTNISRQEAMDIVETMYQDAPVHCELMNGYAYDTTLEWIKNTNELEYDVIETEENPIIYSGRNEYNHICDFADNILEITSETYYSTVIVRGFSASEEKLDNVRFCDESRYSVLKEDTTLSLTDLLSFRVVLYQ